MLARARALRSGSLARMHALALPISDLFFLLLAISSDQAGTHTRLYGLFCVNFLFVLYVDTCVAG